MAITAKLVAELRQRTGLPMMKCKQALVEADGDIEKAIDLLRKENAKMIVKLGGREMKEGLAFTHIAESGAAAVAVLCETEPVARSPIVKEFGDGLAKSLFDNAPAATGDGEALGDLALPDGRTVKEHLEEMVGSTIRENMKIGAWAVFKPESGIVSTYVHHNGKIASLVELGGENLGAHDAAGELGHDLGMQIAFHTGLQAVTRDGVDEEWIAKEREVFLAQVQDMPEERRDQIATGKLNKRLKDVVLLDQPFIKNEKESVAKHVEAVAKEAGTSIEIRRFARIGAGA